MNILITGGLGGIGRHLSRLLLDSGFNITIFDLKTKKTEKQAKLFPNDIVTWGDIRYFENYTHLLSDKDAVIHLAFLIPIFCDTNPFAYQINVEGTKKVITGLSQVNPNCRFIFASTATLTGPTTHETPPISIDHPINPTDTYTRHKTKCENLIENSDLTNWIILRFSEAPYLEITKFLSLRNLELMYTIPADTRVEFVHVKDVALACHNAIQISENKEKFIIAGGSNCQMNYYDQMCQIFKTLYLPAPSRKKFSKTPYYLDWYDTARSQAILQYQTRTLDDYLEDLKRQLGKKRILFRLISPIARLFI